MENRRKGYKQKERKEETEVGRGERQKDVEANKMRAIERERDSVRVIEGEREGIRENERVVR